MPRGFGGSGGGGGGGGGGGVFTYTLSILKSLLLLHLLVNPIETW